MSDIIRRENVVSRISDLLMIELQGKRLPTWNEVYNAINDIPSAEPERTAKVKISDGWFCCCGCDYCTEHYSYDWKYCPMCGARLEWK